MCMASSIGLGRTCNFNLFMTKNNILDLMHAQFEMINKLFALGQVGLERLEQRPLEVRLVHLCLHHHPPRHHQIPHPLVIDHDLVPLNSD